MKKSLVLMAMAGVALASCVNDVAEVAQNDQKKVKIAFESPVLYNNAESRANVFGEISSETVEGSYSYPKAENFVIYAVSHIGDFAGWTSAAAAPFNGQAISYDSSVDGWAPKDENQDYYYWEDGKKMSFAAYSPAELDVEGCTPSYGAAGLSLEGFAVNADPAKQYDLLFSTRSVNNTSANMAHGAEYYSGIPVQFQHALSSIRFSLRNTSQAVVKLTGITLEGLKYKGNFTEGITEGTDFTQYDRDANVDPEWRVADDLITAPYVAFTGDIPFSYEARYVSSILGDAGSTGTEHDLLLMPQTLTEESVVTVNYTVNGKANSKTVGLKDLKSTKFSQTGEVVSETPIAEWEIGKRYTYRLYYSDDTAKKDRIFFSPSTDNWQDVDVIVVAL